MSGKKPFQFSSSPLLSSAHKSHDNGTSDHRCWFLAFSTPCSLFLRKSQGKMLDKNIFHLKQWSRVLMTSCAEQLRMKSLGLFYRPKWGCTFFLPDPSKLSTNTELITGGDEGAWGTEGMISIRMAVPGSASCLLGSVSSNPAGVLIHPHAAGGFGFFPSSEEAQATGWAGLLNLLQSASCLQSRTPKLPHNPWEE